MDFNIFGILAIPALVVICYLIGEVAKASPIDNKWIPIITGVAGGVLGVIAYIIKMPAMYAEDILTAISAGIVSGLAATGINQIYKLFKGKDNG